MLLSEQNFLLLYKFLIPCHHFKQTSDEQWNVFITILVIFGRTVLSDYISTNEVFHNISPAGY